MRELDDRAIYMLKDLSEDQYFQVLKKCDPTITRERSLYLFNKNMNILYLSSIVSRWGVVDKHGSANMWGVNALELFKIEI